MERGPPRFKRSYTLFPYPTLFRSSRATCRKTVAAASPEIVTGSRQFANPPRHAEPGQQSHHHRVERRAELVREHRLRQPAQGEGRDEQRSEEHTSELQSLMRISYAVFCLKKKIK